MVAIKLRPAIVLLGDSLTQFGFGQQGQVGWAQLLSQAYTRRADVFNRGLQGYNSRQVLQILPELLLGGGGGGDSTTTTTTTTTRNDDVRVLFWTLSLGANDAALSPGRERIELDEFGDNLNRIICLLRQADSPSSTVANNPGEETKSNDSITPIILFTAPSCDVQLWKQQLDPDEDPNAIPDNGNEIYKHYRDKTLQVAKQHGRCSVLDTWKILGGEDLLVSSSKQSGYRTDGVHWTGKGNRIVFEGLMDIIRQEYPHLRPMTDGNGQFGTKGSGVPMEGKLWWLYD